MTVRTFRRFAKKDKKWLVQTAKGGQGGAVLRALASLQCGPGSNPDVDAICGFSLLLVLSFAPRGFSPSTPVFPCPQKPACPNSNSISNARTRFNEFTRTPKCSVGEEFTITIYNYKFFSITITLTNWPLTFQPRKVNHSQGRIQLIQKEGKGHLSAMGEGRAPRPPSESAYDSHCGAINMFTKGETNLKTSVKKTFVQEINTCTNNFRIRFRIFWTVCPGHASETLLMNTAFLPW